MAFVYNGRSHASFMVAAYGWPVGYRYGYIPVGGYLPPPLWVPNDFVEDYGYYGIDPPPPNFAWIRYGPDLLLINLDTGEIDREIRGFFQAPGDAQAVAEQWRPAPGDPDELPGDPPPPGQF